MKVVLNLLPRCIVLVTLPYIDILYIYFPEMDRYCSKKAWGRKQWVCWQPDLSKCRWSDSHLHLAIEWKMVSSTYNLFLNVRVTFCVWVPWQLPKVDISIPFLNTCTLIKRGLLAIHFVCKYINWIHNVSHNSISLQGYHRCSQTLERRSDIKMFALT